MPVTSSSQGASPLVLTAKDMWVFLLPLWLGELLMETFRLMDSSPKCMWKVVSKGCAHFLQPWRPANLSSVSHRESGYEASPRNNPPDVWWWRSYYNKSQIFQSLLRKPAAFSKHRIGLSHESSCWIFCRQREQCHGNDRDPLVRKQEIAVRESRGGWAS